MARAGPANAAASGGAAKHDDGLWSKIIYHCTSWMPDEWDKDTLFSYDTVKEIRVLDRRAGFLYYFIQFAVLFYVVVVVFIIKQQYLETEKTEGWMITKVMRPQVDHLGIPWDVYDRITNPTEKGAVFVPTRVVVTKGQKQASCESPLHNCTNDNDCRAGGQVLGCAPSGRCSRFQWCPAEDVTSPSTTTYYLDIEEVELFLQTYVHYHKFNLDVSTTDERLPMNYPHKRANTYRVRDIVRFANIEPEHFIENGAIMLLNAIFTCDLNAHICDMKVEATNVDTKTGYNHVHNHVYWDENGDRTRDSYRMYGIRLLTSATGFGTKTSFSKIMLQISSAISLFTIAETVADFYLCYVVSERKHYYEQKVVETEDFND